MPVRSRARCLWVSCCVIATVVPLGDACRHIKIAQLVLVVLLQSRKVGLLHFRWQLLPCFYAAELSWGASIGHQDLHFAALCHNLSAADILPHCSRAYGTVMCFRDEVSLISLLDCRPISFNWNKTVNGACSSTQLGFLLTGIFNTIVYVTFVILPMPKPYFEEDRTDLHIRYRSSVRMTSAILRRQESTI